MPSFYAYRYTNVRKPDYYIMFDTDLHSIMSKFRVRDIEADVTGRWRLDRSKLQDNKMSKSHKLDI